MAHLIPELNFQPLIGGAIQPGAKLYSYAAGTTTPLATYTDQTGGTPNPNPTILDSEGSAAIWLADVAYKLVLKDSSGATIWTRDAVRHINVNSIDTNSIEDGAVTTVKIADDAVNINQLANESVTTDKLAVGALSNNTEGHNIMADGYLSANAEGRAKMEDGYLSADTAGRAKMGDGFVTFAKLFSRNAGGSTATEGNVALSSSSGPFSQSGAITNVSVTNLSVTITTSGRPVFVGLVADGSGGTNDSQIQASGQLFMRILKNGSAWTRTALGSADGAAVYYPPGAVQTIDAPVAGTYTYSVDVTMASGAVQVRYCKLMAFEF